MNRRSSPPATGRAEKPASQAKIRAYKPLYRRSRQQIFVKLINRREMNGRGGDTGFTGKKSGSVSTSVAMWCPTVPTVTVLPEARCDGARSISPCSISPCSISPRCGLPDRSSDHRGALPPAQLAVGIDDGVTAPPKSVEAPPGALPNVSVPRPSDRSCPRDAPFYQNSPTPDASPRGSMRRPTQSTCAPPENGRSHD